MCIPITTLSCDCHLTKQCSLVVPWQFGILFFGQTIRSTFNLFKMFVPNPNPKNGCTNDKVTLYNKSMFITLE